ncbi:hypothetical protein KFK09_004248 [Dendrobium nobile]|uniref:Uncharacterized protein n=1 Tax=Dendrobium nobile TaxID=94219 RepID=A0A8T3C5N2_DENNO|nr:hypothetical protein KFK09_004248 [Dendrobium nobile]
MLLKLSISLDSFIILHICYLGMLGCSVVFLIIFCNDYQCIFAIIMFTVVLNKIFSVALKFPKTKKKDYNLGIFCFAVITIIQRKCKSYIIFIF